MNSVIIMDKEIEKLTDMAILLAILENHKETMIKMEEKTERRVEMEIGVLKTPIGDLSVFALANHPFRFGLREGNVFIDYTSLDSIIKDPQTEFVPMG